MATGFQRYRRLSVAAAAPIRGVVTHGELQSDIAAYFWEMGRAFRRSAPVSPSQKCRLSLIVSRTQNRTS